MFPLGAEVTDSRQEAAIGNHDPDRYDGRTWHELSELEQEAAILAASSKRSVSRGRDRVSV